MRMKALVVNALGRGFDYEDVQIAQPIGREVLVNVEASGLCHTDLLFATHNIVPTPAVLGHEVAGIVAAVGPDVAQLRVGDHVVGSLAQSCGAWGRCLSGPLRPGYAALKDGSLTRNKVSRTQLSIANFKTYQHGEIMKRLAVVLTLTCLLELGISARAQEVDKVVVNVPFEFGRRPDASCRYIPRQPCLGSDISSLSHPELRQQRGSAPHVFRWSFCRPRRASLRACRGQVLSQ